MSHPSSLDLESFAAGETLEQVSSHIEGCAACAAFVERLRSALAAGRQRLGRDLVAARLAQAITPRRRRWPLVVAGLATPLAAAAALFLVLRGPSSPIAAPLAPTSPVAIATERSPSAAPSDITFKGGLQTAVIRERSGEQKRFTGALSIRPGDRLRVEVALDREQVIVGGVLSDDGSWLELMPEGARPPGTHFSERSARVDDSPMRGTIIVGSPEAVAEAKKSRRLGTDAHGASIRLDWEGP